MTQPCPITPEQHREQIEHYAAEYPSYACYADVLRRVLQRACAVAFPEALVQSRPKSISSFAGKCARKFAKYPDPVNQMTDLCGGRVIVQTLQQVQAAKQFIEANFEILERDDKGLSLSEDKFGYRDMHYVIRLRPDRCPTLGITPDEIEQIGQRCAEIQVRTWLQHAWADTFHDRMYKNPLQLPLDVRRTGALLAALMEEGDRTFDQMADHLDGMIANYTTFATRAEVDAEIAAQSLILVNEPDESKRPALALELARLLAASGQYDRVVQTLDPYREVRDANRCELLQDLGYALCQQHRDAPQGAEYQRGVGLLEQTRVLCAQPDGAAVVHLRKQASLHARALWRLGGALEPLSGREHEAREFLRQAYEHEPGNPYYLVEMLGAEIYYAHQQTLPAAMRTAIRQAVATCRAHAESGIELPRSCFTAGRLSLLLDNPHDAFVYYARGVRYILDATHCVPPDALQRDRQWLRRLHFGEAPSPACQWIAGLLALAERLAAQPAASGTSGDDAQPVLIVVGGAASMDDQRLAVVRPLLESALEGFHGQVLCGGTAVGVPGCVGEVAAALAGRGSKTFELVGYLPERLPHDAPQDVRYDRLVPCGRSEFSPEQLLRTWSDILDSGVRPADVTVLGFGGGPLSAAEYRLALALGASVAVVAGTGGAVDDLLQDPLWRELPNLFPVPHDAASIRAVVVPAARTFDPELLDQMAATFHQSYVANSTGRLPDNMKPWPKLPETFKQANRDQASYSVRILEAAGYGVREAESPVVYAFTDEDEPRVEQMAEFEHGRWNADRLRNGWRHGPRDNQRKLHDCLVPWSELPEGIRRYDREAVRKFPEILAQAGLEVYRK
jgi:ppGpp synthetase/RelA/SpoT-type nucleotidyltranferase